MKRIFLALIMATVCVSAHAQHADAPEKDHVSVTLNDGTVVEGYVRTYWVDGKLFKRMNTTFTLSETPRV